MTTAFDVPADLLIERLAGELKASGKAPPPAWAPFARTGLHTEKAPRQPDWWHRRLAAVLRKIYVMGPVGSSRLSAEFGGKRDGGSAPSHPRKGSGSVTREALQQLEALGYVSKAETEGRRITPAGQKLLDDHAHTILIELAAKNPELTKYARAK
ncbi:MAG TPA: 30S ribosomal protein S19e [Thermoplasmata archaeon]|nr:30S ribosomal protein S19e [Thermoplasmata archaeon]